MILRSAHDVMITVPGTAGTLQGFRQWVRSPSFPEFGHITFCLGDVLLDMSPDRIETHNKVKTELTRVLGNLVRALDLGCYYQDRLWLTNDDADLSTEPDATFASWATLESGRLRVVSMQGAPEDGLEMRGTPDWVAEVISDTSVEKDSRLLRKAYHAANIPEYWLIDARGEVLRFSILHRETDDYRADDDRTGWQFSFIFQRRFRLDRERDRVGGWKYTLNATPP